MISWDEAFAIAMNAAQTLPAERVPFHEALHRVLAEDVAADMDMPPFDKSLVDGYACRRAELGERLEVVETIAAGYAPRKAIGPGQCAKIMTGAMTPEGADCVFMVERSEPDGEGYVRCNWEKTGENIARKAQDIKRGEVLLRSGDRITPACIAVLAGMGCVEPLVTQRPKVAVMATGDELVEPSTKPGLSQIRNSNGYQTAAQLSELGADALYMGIIRDNEPALDAAIGTALQECDVIILSGGVSMGEFDLVPGVLKKHGVEIQFNKVAIQPGKPTVFGTSGSAYCFGLPGNPVSTFVIFELLVKPFILRLMGNRYVPPALRLPLEETMTRKSPERKAWVPAVITDRGTVKRIPYHGSAHINALCYADAIISFAIGESEVEAGTLMEAHLLRA